MNDRRLTFRSIVALALISLEGFTAAGAASARYRASLKPLHKVFRAVGAVSLVLLALPLNAAFGIQQQPPLRSISSTPTCSACRIDIPQTALLVLPTDSLSFARGSRSTITRLSDGRFLILGLNETRAPAVLSATGKFIRLLGSVGRGPGEYDDPTGVAVAPGDSVWIFDGARKHVLTRDLRFVRTERTRAIIDGLVSPTGSIVFQSRIGTPDRAGYPLHILRPDGELGVSFGIANPVLEPRVLEANGEDAASHLQRRLERADVTSFWVYSRRKFLLERYDFDGRMLDQARHAMDGWYAEASLKQPGDGEFKGLKLPIVVQSKQPEMVWLVYAVRNALYRDPSVYSPTDKEILQMMDLVIEALDAKTMKVIATSRFPRTGVLEMKNAPDMIAVYEPIDADAVFMSYSIRTMNVVRPQQ